MTDEKEQLWRFHYREVTEKCIIVKGNSLADAIKDLEYIGLETAKNNCSCFLHENNIDISDESINNPKQWEKLPSEFASAISLRCKDCVNFLLCNETEFTAWDPVGCTKYQKCIMEADP